MHQHLSYIDTGEAVMTAANEIAHFLAITDHHKVNRLSIHVHLGGCATSVFVLLSLI